MLGTTELLVLLVLLGVMLGLFVWWLLMLIEALRIPSARWKATGQNQLIYVLAMIFLGIVGTVLYVLIPRKQLT